MIKMIIIVILGIIVVILCLRELVPLACRWYSEGDIYDEQLAADTWWESFEPDLHNDTNRSFLGNEALCGSLRRPTIAVENTLSPSVINVLQSKNKMTTSQNDVLTSMKDQQTSTTDLNDKVFVGQRERLSISNTKSAKSALAVPARQESSPSNTKTNKTSPARQESSPSNTKINKTSPARQESSPSNTKTNKTSEDNIANARNKSQEIDEASASTDSNNLQPSTKSIFALFTLQKAKAKERKTSKENEDEPA